jgi:NYN domain
MTVGKNSADKLLMADLISWTAHNLPPAHFFLISSDGDFATILHRLRMNNYNVLLSCCDSRTKASLYSAATLMWPWVPLVKGEDFTPKQFNHPPDGMYGSQYGHQKEHLDDPFEEVQ